MRIVTLEEHFTLPPPEGQSALVPTPNPAVANTSSVVANAADKMTDIGAGRIADMDRNGITVQVLSKAGNPYQP